MWEDLRGLNSVKLKEDYVAKVIDLMPADSEAVHKIFHDIAMDEGEINAILEIVKKY